MSSATCRTRIGQVKAQTLATGEKKDHRERIEARNCDIVTFYRPPDSFESDSLPGQLVIAELEHSEGQAAFEEEQHLVEPRGSGETVFAVKDGNKDPNKDSVWNRCQFQCALCAANFTDRRNIKSHVVSAHNLSYQDYVAR